MTENKTEIEANVDHANPAVADRPPRPGAKDRPGFDLGGAVHPTYGGFEGLTNPIGDIPMGEEEGAPPNLPPSGSDKTGDE